MPERASARPGTTRRVALGAGMTAAGLAACTGPESTDAPGSGSAPGPTPSCELTPEGTVEFATLYPGWYDRRTVHVHVKVHVVGDVVHTGQLYFDDGTNTLVAATDPYAGRADPVVVNADDMFSGTIVPENTLRAAGSPDEGYQAGIVLGVRA